MRLLNDPFLDFLSPIEVRGTTDSAGEEVVAMTYHLDR